MKPQPIMRFMCGGGVGPPGAVGGGGGFCLVTWPIRFGTAELLTCHLWGLREVAAPRLPSVNGGGKNEPSPTLSAEQGRWEVTVYPVSELKRRGAGYRKNHGFGNESKYNRQVLGEFHAGYVPVNKRKSKK